MFDLSNLNDYEFEILSRDVMQVVRGQKLYTFSRGVDGGVDICDAEKDPTVVIQAKHYINSTYAQLKAALRQELPKVQKLAPKEYYVCTSQKLSRKNKVEIIEIFGDFMPDISYVLGAEDFDAFLEDKKNNDIVQKNYKLWLCASNVLSLINNQDIFIDCAELITDIEERATLFVETQAYRDALERLNKDNVIIIIGAPGVGKSTVSDMLLLHYVEKKYNVRYASDNNISEIKKTISLAPDQKEIVLLDDFLGQHYLNLKESQPNELRALISYVARSKNKKLILNSRVTILNEAEQRHYLFQQMMTKYEHNKYLLDLDKMTELEKAKILYNHLYFNKLPHEYILEIKNNRRYLEIVRHASYNPRLIEFITRKCNYGAIPSHEYFQFVMNVLKNPKNVWRDEFRNRLEMCDRILMNTLYSLSNTSIDKHILEEAVNKRIQNEECDTSINQFRESFLRLTESLIKNVDMGEEIKVAAINPSVNDYLLGEIEENPAEQKNIIENAVVYEQIFKVMKSEEAKEYYKKRLYTFDYLKLKTLRNNSSFYFLKGIVELDVRDERLKEKVLYAVENAYANLDYQSKFEYGDILTELCEKEYFECYELLQVVSSPEKLKKILEPLYFSGKILVTEAIFEKCDSKLDEYVIQVFKDTFIDRIAQDTQDKLSDELESSVSAVIEDTTEKEIAEYMQGETEILDEKVWEVLEDIAYQNIEDAIIALGGINEKLVIAMDDFDISDMRYYVDIAGTIKDALTENDDELDEDRIPYEHKSDEELIVEMFER